MRRFVTTIVLLGLMGGFGFGVNRWIASRKVNLTAGGAAPDQTVPLVTLPGTIYVAQNGVLYSFIAGHFTAIKLPSTDSLNQKIAWTQPSILPNGNLLAVMRGSEYSDLYEITPGGQIVTQLTHNYVGSDPTTIRNDHWISWPHVSPDGKTLFYSLDSPKQFNSYEVDFNIWASPLDGKSFVMSSKYNTNGTVRGLHWTTPNFYTGGDTDPIPLNNGKLLYVSYSVGGDLKVTASLDVQATSRTRSIQLTTPTQNCNAAALSRDQTLVAMICSNNNQDTQLEVATFDGTTLGTPKVLVNNCLCASPVWAPDGSGVVYIAPSDTSGHFQLWWLPGAGTASPAQPKLVTSNLDLDATSTPAWSQATASISSVGATAKP